MENNQYSLCPICGEEGLLEKTEMALRKSGSYERDVDFHSSHCVLCGSATLTQEQAALNKAKMTDFYSEAKTRKKQNFCY